MAIFVARVASPAELGVWGIIYAALIVGLNINRSISSTPVLIGLADGRPDLKNGALGSSLIVGIVFSVGFVVSAAFFSSLAVPLILFGIAAPVVFLQDNFRYEFFRNGAAKRAFGVDFVWLVVQSICLLTASLTASNSYVLISLCWFAGAFCSLIICIFVTRQLPSAVSGLAFMLELKSAGARLVADSLLGSVSVNSIAPLVAVSVGMAQAGYFRAGLTLLGAYGLFVSAAGPLVTLYASRLQESGASTRSAFHLWTAGFSALGLFFGLFLLSLPDFVGEMLAGESWAGLSTILVALVLQVCARPIFTGVPIMLRAERRFSALVRLRIVTSCLAPFSVFVGGLAFGILGAAYGWALGTAVNSFISYGVYRSGGIARRT